MARARQPSSSGFFVAVVVVQPTHVAGDVAVQAGEDDVAVGELARLAPLHDEGANAVREGQGLLPAHRVAVRLVRRPVRRAHGVQVKVRVQGQQKDEALAHRARGAEHAWTRRERGPQWTAGRSTNRISCVESRQTAT